MDQEMTVWRCLAGEMSVSGCLSLEMSVSGSLSGCFTGRHLVLSCNKNVELGGEGGK